jgi:hypothetical protein
LAESENSLQCCQDPATRSYVEPHECSANHHTLFLSTFIYIKSKSLWRAAQKPDYMVQSGRPLLSNVYNQNAYFSGNRVRTSLVAVVLKAFPIQRTYETIASIARQRLGVPLSATVNFGYGGNEKTCFRDNGQNLTVR